MVTFVHFSNISANDAILKRIKHETFLSVKSYFSEVDLVRAQSCFN